jgi:hypothetical protein
MNHARPQPRQIREREHAKDRPQLRLIRVREQSTFASSPRQQTRQQSVRSSDQGAVSPVRDLTAAMDMDTPRAGHYSELADAKTSLLTGSSREPEPAAIGTRHRLVVAISPTIRFPVHIRIISNHVCI